MLMLTSVNNIQKIFNNISLKSPPHKVFENNKKSTPQ